ncbi:MAG: SMC-Scp complex subunit ScpB [Candidatus Omnitrophota bacterium]
MEQNTTEPLQYIQGVVEALLFVNERPITLEQIKRVLETVTPAEIKKAIEGLSEDYRSRSGGITIQEIAGGYQMLSNPEYVAYVRNFYKTKHKEKLSKPALETLAIIAYKQPVTRADIELIRGVNSDGVVALLLDKELIKLAGRKDVPGRPFLYGTTKQFLEYFGLKSLDTLPNLEELVALQAQSEESTSNEYLEGSMGEGGADNSLEKQKQQAIARAEKENSAQIPTQNSMMLQSAPEEQDPESLSVDGSMVQSTEPQVAAAMTESNPSIQEEQTDEFK